MHVVFQYDEKLDEIGVVTELSARKSGSHEEFRLSCIEIPDGVLTPLLNAREAERKSLLRIALWLFQHNREEFHRLKMERYIEEQAR